MPVLGSLSVNMSANTASLESAFNRVDRRSRLLGDGGKEGVRKITNAITDLGLNVLGLDGKFARLAEGALLLGTGGAATVAITGGLLAIGALMRSGNKEAEEYQKHLDEVGDKYIKMAEAAQQATRSQILYNRANAEESLRVLNRDIADPDRAANRLGMIEGIKAALFGSGETMAENLAAPLQRQRAVLLEQLAAMDVALDAFDKKERDRLAGANQSRQPGSSLDSGPAFAALERRQREVEAIEKLAGQFLTKDGYVGARGPAGDGLAGLDDSINAKIRGLETVNTATLEAISKTTIGKQKQLAAFTEEVWRSAARNIQTALAGTFERLFDGQLKSLSDFGKSVVQIIEQTLAQIAAAEVAAGVTSLIRGGLGLAVGGAGGGGGGAVLPTGPFGLGGDASLRASPTIIQNITYSPVISAMDGQSVQRVLRQNRGALIAEVARGARDSVAVPAALRGGR